MNKLYLIILVFLVSCGQSFNSNSKDFLLGSQIYCSDTSQIKLCSANEVIAKNCINCHSGYHNSWSSYLTNQDWINSALIATGNSDSSSLIIKLKNAGGNMPEGAAPLSDADYQVLRSWIDSL